MTMTTQSSPPRQNAYGVMVSSPARGGPRIAISPHGDATWKLPLVRLAEPIGSVDTRARLANPFLKGPTADYQVLHKVANHEDANVEDVYIHIDTKRRQPKRLADKSPLRWIRLDTIHTRGLSRIELEVIERSTKDNSHHFEKGPTKTPFHIFTSATRAQDERLRSALRAAGNRLDGYAANPVTRATLDQAQRTLTRARRDYAQRDREAAWAGIRHIERMEVLVMSEEELRLHFHTVRQEGLTKLNGWRLRAFRKIVGAKRSAVSRAALSRAMGLIEDSQETRFHSLRLLDEQIKTVSLGLMLSIAAFFLIAWPFKDFTAEFSRAGPGADPGGMGRILSACFAMGAVGACVSALISFAKTEPRRIPDRMMQRTVSLSRPAIGGTSAVVAGFLISAGVSNLVHPNIAFMYATAFAFGFSERLVFSAVNTLAKDPGRR